jgi:hypothetical protein
LGSGHSQLVGSAINCNTVSVLTHTSHLVLSILSPQKVHVLEEWSLGWQYGREYRILKRQQLIGGSYPDWGLCPQRN